MAEKYRIGDLVWAKVLELLPNGAILQLDEETPGFLHLSELNLEEKLAEGTELLVKVIGSDHQGRPLLSRRRITDLDRGAAEFHREALEFRSILSNRALPLSEETKPEDRLERRLSRWLAEAEAAISTVRRRRNERLSKGPIE